MTSGPSSVVSGGSVESVGQRRSTKLVLTLSIVTLNLYWLYWIYQVYKEVRKHAPSASSITPGAALGLLFVPLANVFWYFAICRDFPRSILRMQQREQLGDDLLNTRLATSLFCVGSPLSFFLVLVHPNLWIVAATLFLCATLLCQNALNDHWRVHETGDKLPLRPAGRATSAGRGPGGLAWWVGVRDGGLAWMQWFSFVAALLLSGLLQLVLTPVVFPTGFPRLETWIVNVLEPIVLAGSALIACRLLQNAYAAAASAAVPFAVLMSFVRWLLPLQTASEVQQAVWMVYFVTHYALFSFSLLAGLVFWRRWLRGAWVAVWLAVLCADAAAGIAAPLAMGAAMGFVSWPRTASDALLLISLVGAATAATAFWAMRRFPTEYESASRVVS